MAANILISQDNSNPYSETDIRQNHVNPLQVIAGANNNNYSSGFTNTQAQFYSSDGGNSWAQSSLPAVTGDSLQGDPACEWTSDGTAWALTLGISSTGNLVLRSFKSSNAGKDWTHDSEIGSQTAADRPTFQVDHSSTSTHKDNMYVTWHQAAAPSCRSAWDRAGHGQTPHRYPGLKPLSRHTEETSKPMPTVMCSSSGRMPAARPC